MGPGESAETYSPAEASRVLGRSGRKISERRIRQMLQAGELEGEQTEGGRWRIPPRRVVHQLLADRREREQLRTGPESPSESSESVRELMERVARPGEGARALRRAFGAHGADGEHHTRRTGPAPGGATGDGAGGAPEARGATGGGAGRSPAGFLVPAVRRKLEGRVPRL